MFDLDGTLADTLADLAAAGNHLCAVFGRPPLPPDDYRTLVGRGAPVLAQRLLELEAEDPQLEEAVRVFRKHLIEHRHSHTAPFAGIPALLDELVSRGMTLAVLSNKPDEATVDVVQRVFADWPFVDVRGHRDGTPPKPEPMAALEIAGAAGIAPEAWVYVGDSGVDMRTGVNAGMCPVGVTWGFRAVEELREHGARHLIDEPGQLLELIQEARPAASGGA